MKSKFKLIDEERYEGAMARTRGEWLWNGETPTRRAISGKKRYATKKDIKAIFYKNVGTSEPTVIQQAFVDHYRGLHANKKKMKEGFERNFLQPMPRLKDDNKPNLVFPNNSREIGHAIDGFGAGNSTGLGGLGATFYNAFKFQLSQSLHCFFSVSLFIQVTYSRVQL